MVSDYGDPDIYRSPRYTPDVTQALSECTTSAMWDDWDLAGLLTDVPHAFAGKMGAKFGIFCSTGTAGLHASLMALELLPGDEVIVPCMTFIRAVTPLVHLGLQPVLVDVDPQTGNIQPEAIAAAISPRTRAVVVVHMWGIPADMAGIKEVCQRQGLQVIEDFSHAHFSMHELGSVGSFGSVGYASLQRKKTFSVGEGGIIVTNNPDIYDRLRQITSPGSFKGTPNYNEFSGFGLNMRMSPFSGVVARCLFDRAGEIVEARAKHADEFSSLLSETGVIHPPTIPSYVRLVSAYGYKPSLSGEITLDQLAAGNAGGFWRFGRFSYDAIAENPFWRKSRAHYPFALQIQPKVLGPFTGYQTYLAGRVSLAVPTVGSDYWTDDVRDQWRSDLMRRLQGGT
ncbi:MAG: aminotransferase class I/II-fold pyridoxal phosphate-dependent enzyme [Rhizobiaceae bacterium]